MKLTVSVGLSYCKFLAKVASDFEKPRGFSVIGKAGSRRLSAQTTRFAFLGRGKSDPGHAGKGRHYRYRHRFRTWRKANWRGVTARSGLRMAKLSHGQDARSVSAGGEAKSISSETTFNTDISDHEELVRKVRYLSEKVSKRLKEKHLAGQTVVLKLKTADFKSRTRNRTLPDPTRLQTGFSGHAVEHAGKRNRWNKIPADRRWCFNPDERRNRRSQ